MVHKQKVLQPCAGLCDKPVLGDMAEILRRAFRLNSDRNHKGCIPFMVYKLHTYIRNRMSRAKIAIFTSLFSVNGPLKCPCAFAVSGGVKVFVSGETIADGVHNGGLTHRIDTNQIGHHAEGDAVVLKIVPVDQAKTRHFNHQTIPPQQD